VRATTLLLLLATVSGAACSSSRRALTETPEAPPFDDVNAEREGQAALAAPDLARRLGSRFRAYGLQPVTRTDRRHALAPDTIAAAFVAGKDALRASHLIVVVVSQQASPAALGGFAELARVMARLARYYLIPEPTLLFATLPAGRERLVLEQLTRAPMWPTDSVEVLVIGNGLPGARTTLVPEQATAGATARAAYTLLYQSAYNHRTVAKGDSVLRSGN